MNSFTHLLCVFEMKNLVSIKLCSVHSFKKISQVPSCYFGTVNLRKSFLNYQSRQGKLPRMFTLDKIWFHSSMASPQHFYNFRWMFNSFPLRKQLHACNYTICGCFLHLQIVWLSTWDKLYLKKSTFFTQTSVATSSARWTFWSTSTSSRTPTASLPSPSRTRTRRRTLRIGSPSGSTRTNLQACWGTI